MSRSTTTDAFLQRKPDGYRVLFLGKNGEPQVNKQIEVELRHRYRQTANQVLTTDADGQIKLGPLEDVNRISVESRTLLIGARFILPDYYQDSASTWLHQEEMSVLEGDSFNIPINMRQGEQTLRRKWVSLVRRINDVIVEDWFD